MRIQMRSPVSGLFFPVARKGDKVKVNALLAKINQSGIFKEILSPTNGIIEHIKGEEYFLENGECMIIISTPPIN